MPASRSPSRSANTPRHSYRPIALIVLAAVFAVVIAALPASIISHFLPPVVRAEDFSGSFWHGSAGKIIVNERPAGALEWRLHPSSLLGMALAADLHWVKVGFEIDAAVQVHQHGFAARDIKGGGPIEDLHDLGIAPAWRGRAVIDLQELRGDFSKPLTALGSIQVSNLASVQFAEGADLGGYALRFPRDALGADGNVTAQLSDTGGPLGLQAVMHYTPDERTFTLSGYLSERPDAPAALRREIGNLSQLHAADAQGRVPVDFEFRF
ncbi:MAG: type II secretion system protein N [Gammaproteobacteria bacterium]